ncbi:unnamed protein product [Owenia fusiformis]|uniref:Galactose-3-O-sulfotransferase 2-like n=1 Tax=Owenia fusiformis TaxID=6347 RepID=A0A8S4NLS1_OWEFU|nr:unnamed protein product [Owenia fusiformis]
MEFKAVITSGVSLAILLSYIYIITSIDKYGSEDLPAFTKPIESKQIHDRRIKNSEERYKNTLDNKNQWSIPQQRQKSNTALTTTHRGVFYLKVNKAGSCTLQAMFNKYADKHNQIVGMPCSNSVGERHLVGWPEPFKPEHLIPLSKNYTYWEHLNEHIKYSSKIKQVMAPGSVFVASIREPFSHFFSYYNFYSMEKTYKGYLKEPNKFKYFLDNIKTMPHLELIHHMPPSNPIAQCFGIKQEEQYNITVIQEKINEIEMEFDLVILAEFMDESLILLTECSDLTIEDVVILKNANVKNIKKSKPVLTPKEYENLIQWNIADSMIYNHFNKTLWEKIDKFGRHKMAIKILELDMAKSIKQKECDSVQRKPNLKRIEDLKIKHDCMIQNLDYIGADKYFRNKMTEKGIYDIEKAQKTCKYPPNKHGQ